MNTINQSYTKKQRLEIAKDLRSIQRSDSTKWHVLLSEQSLIYVKSVLASYGQEYFTSFAWSRRVDADSYPLGGLDGYIHDALNRLADELEALK